MEITSNNVPPVTVALSKYAFIHLFRFYPIFHTFLQLSLSTSEHLPSPNSSPAPPRMSFFSRKFRHGTKSSHSTLKHTRSSSLSAIDGPDHDSSQGTSTISASVLPSSWKWRPSVLGHFSFTSLSQIQSSSSDPFTPPTGSRQSTSSFTSATHTSTDEEAVKPAPPSVSHSRRFFSYAAGSGSSHSIWSQPTSLSIASSSNEAQKQRRVLPKSRLGIDSDDIGDDDDDVDEDPVTYDRTAPFVAYASDGSQDVSRILLNTLSNSIRQRKKKKLVIRGVRLNERRKLEAARRWCEVRCLYSHFCNRQT